MPGHTGWRTRRLDAFYEEDWPVDAAPETEDLPEQSAVDDRATEVLGGLAFERQLGGNRVIAERERGICQRDVDT